MAAYFPLVMGDTPSLWLNNLPASSITSWADLSQAFTSNFQVTYNRPGNAFNLGEGGGDHEARRAVMGPHQPVLREP
jgi:hypothetical protein